MLEFKYKDISLRELSFTDFKNFTKHLLNDNNALINEFLENLIFKITKNKKLDLFEKIAVLITLRSVCISSMLELQVKCSITNKEFNYTLNLNDVLKVFNEFIKKNINKTFKKITYNEKFIVYLTIPTDLFFNFNEETLYKFIKSIELNGQLYENLSSEQIGNLPYYVLSDVKEFVVNIENIFNEFLFLKINSPFADSITSQLPFSLIQCTFLDFVKIIYKKNLMELYELEYVLMSKLKLNYTLIQNSTFAENMLYLGLYKSEMDEKSKASNAKPQSQLNMPFSG